MRNVGKLKKTENDWEETKKAQKALEEERDEKTKSIRELQVACMFSIHKAAFAV